MSQEGRSRNERVAEKVVEIQEELGWQKMTIEVFDDPGANRVYRIVELPPISEGFIEFEVKEDGTIEFVPNP